MGYSGAAFFIILFALALVIVGLLVAVVWLSRLYLKLNKNYITIESITQSNKNDIYGLCSAARL